MVPILNALNVQCAVYGNHDFGLVAAFIVFLVFFAVFVINHFNGPGRAITSLNQVCVFLCMCGQ